MEQGQVEQQIIKQALARGEPLPKKIRDAPELTMGLELYFIGYSELSSSRGMSDAIPWEAIMAWCQYNLLDEEQTDAMLFHCMKMDIARADFMEKKQKAASKKGSKGGHTRNGR